MARSCLLTSVAFPHSRVPCFPRLGHQAAGQVETGEGAVVEEVPLMGQVLGLSALEGLEEAWDQEVSGRVGPAG